MISTHYDTIALFGYEILSFMLFEEYTAHFLPLWEHNSPPASVHIYISRKCTFNVAWLFLTYNIARYYMKSSWRRQSADYHASLPLPQWSTTLLIRLRLAHASFRRANLNAPGFITATRTISPPPPALVWLIWWTRGHIHSIWDTFYWW